MRFSSVGNVWCFEKLTVGHNVNQFPAPVDPENSPGHYPEPTAVVHTFRPYALRVV